MKKPAIKEAVTADNELDLDELDQVSGGFGYKGSYGSVDVGAGYGVGVSAGIAHGGPNGDFYGSLGAGTPNFGISGGAQANLVFGKDNATFDDVVTGNSSTIQFGFGQVSWNENGVAIGLGPSGLGYSESTTTNLGGGIDHGHSDEPSQLAIDAGLNSIGHEPAPQLTDWSTAYGEHEGGPAAPGSTDNHAPDTSPGSLADQAGINDIGSHPDAGAEHGVTDGHGVDEHGSQDANGHDASTQDANAHDASAQDANGHDAGTQDASGHDTSAQDAGHANDAGSTDHSTDSYNGNDFNGQGDNYASNDGGGGDFGGGGGDFA